MAKRKEVKINEEQIRDMMTGDIPAVFMEKNHGNNAAGSQKEDGKEPETENQSRIPAVPNKVEDSGISTGEEVPPPGPPGENTPEKERLAGLSRTSV